VVTEGAQICSRAAHRHQRASLPVPLPARFPPPRLVGAVDIRRGRRSLGL